MIVFQCAASLGKIIGGFNYEYFAFRHVSADSNENKIKVFSQQLLVETERFNFEARSNVFRQVVVLRWIWMLLGFEREIR